MDSNNENGFLRIVVRGTEEEVSRFAPGYRFPYAYVESDTVYTEFLAEAMFQGREVDFLTGWFPEKDT